MDLLSQNPHIAFQARGIMTMRPGSLPTLWRSTRVYLHSKTIVDAGDRHLRDHGYFNYGKNPKTQFYPHAGIKMAQVLGSQKPLPTNQVFYRV